MIPSYLDAVIILMSCIRNIVVHVLVIQLYLMSSSRLKYNFMSCNVNVMCEYIRATYLYTREESTTLQAFAVDGSFECLV